MYISVTPLLFAPSSAMGFHMPLPYGPAPSPDKPMAKAHPSFGGVHSLVISSGWRWGVESSDENWGGNNRIQSNCPGSSHNRSIIWLLDIFIWEFFFSSTSGDLNDRFQNPRSEMEMWSLAAWEMLRGEWDHNASCPGGGDTGMQSSRSPLRNTTPHDGGKRRPGRMWCTPQVEKTFTEKEIILIIITVKASLHRMSQMIYYQLNQEKYGNRTEAARNISPLSYSRKINTVLETRCCLNSWCLSMPI